jgi:hypothetical protein
VQWAPVEVPALADFLVRLVASMCLVVQRRATLAKLL